jgi:hypothetical protein
MNGHIAEERIRIRAYAVWEREGRTGDALAHWRRAEEELAQEAQAPARMALGAPSEWSAVTESAVERLTRREPARRPRGRVMSFARRLAGRL